MSRYNHRIFPVFSFPKLLTVNCYLLSEPQIVFGNCQLSTVTLGIDDIDLSCDMMKNKTPKNLEHIVNIRIFATYNGTNTEINFSYFKGFLRGRMRIPPLFLFFTLGQLLGFQLQRKCH